MSLMKKKLEVLKRLAVGKDGRNDFGKYKYIKVDDILQELKNHLAEVGLALSMRAGQISTEDLTPKGHRVTVRVTYTLTDPETAEHESCPVWGQAHDTGDKALYKAYAGAFKYWAIQSFAIAGDGMDPEGPNDIETQKAPAPKATPQAKAVPQRKTTPAQPAPTTATDEELEKRLKRLIAKRVREVLKIAPTEAEPGLDVDTMRAIAANLCSKFKVTELRQIPADEEGHAAYFVNAGQCDLAPKPPTQPTPTKTPRARKTSVVDKLNKQIRAKVVEHSGLPPRSTGAMKAVMKIGETLCTIFQVPALDQVTAEQLPQIEDWVRKIGKTYVETIIVEGVK